MRNATFQMYDDDVDANTPLSYSLRRGAGVRSTSAAAYVPARFPTRNITSPIVLLWGDQDSLVDINTMLTQLPTSTQERKLAGYEHVDVLWGRDVHVDVIPEVMEVLRRHCILPERLAALVNGASRAGLISSK
jgi:lysosomal acid lipase/cholesteryl ester hydrolase